MTMKAATLWMAVHVIIACWTGSLASQGKSGDGVTVKVTSTGNGNSGNVRTDVTVRTDNRGRGRGNGDDDDFNGLDNRGGAGSSGRGNINDDDFDGFDIRGRNATNRGGNRPRLSDDFGTDFNEDFGLGNDFIRDFIRRHGGGSGGRGRPLGRDRRRMAATIIEALEKNPRTTILAAALKAFPDVFLSSISSNTTSVTVFAPEDSALRSVIKAFNFSSLDSLDNTSRALIPLVLSYHIATVPLFASQLRNNLILPTLLLNSTLAVDLRASRLFIIRGLNSAANIVYTNIRAGQSVIHLIDNVLLPFNPVPVKASTIGEAAAAANLSSLVAAVTKAGLLPFLSNPDLEGTVFAPTDEAIATALTTLGFTLDSVPVATLNKILLYHVLPVYRPSASFVADTVTDTFLTGQTLKFVYSAFAPYRRWQGPQSSLEAGPPRLTIKAFGSRAGVIVPDVFAGKAVIHVVDAVLIPDLS